MRHDSYLSLTNGGRIAAGRVCQLRARLDGCRAHRGPPGRSSSPPHAINEAHKSRGQAETLQRGGAGDGAARWAPGRSGNAAQRPLSARRRGVGAARRRERGGERGPRGRPPTVFSHPPIPCKGKGKGLWRQYTGRLCLQLVSVDAEVVM